MIWNDTLSLSRFINLINFVHLKMITTKFNFILPLQWTINQPQANKQHKNCSQNKEANIQNIYGFAQKMLSTQSLFYKFNNDIQLFYWNGVVFDSVREVDNKIIKCLINSYFIFQYNSVIIYFQPGIDLGVADRPHYGYGPAG